MGSEESVQRDRYREILDPDQMGTQNSTAQLNGTNVHSQENML